MGWLQGKSDWTIYSNRESGNGRSDIQIECNDGKHGIIIEVKHTKEKGQLSALCDKALEQIQEKGYQSSLVENGITEILEYGIAFHRKSCCVRVEKIKL